MADKVWVFNKITLDDMMEYIETKAPKDKDWFKEIAFVERNNKKVYNHMKAVRAFANKYMPEIIPVKKPKEPNKSDKLKDW